MKRANNLITAIAEIENLRLAFWKAKKGKSYSKSVVDYRNKLEANLLQLRAQILDNRVIVGNYRFFTIYDPKERQICESDFREQVLHHAVMNICDPYFERHQIFDSYASRRGKGTYAAIDRAKLFTKKYAYFLKLDVRKFFAEVHHGVLKRQLFRLFKDKHLFSVLESIIDSYEASPDRGLPIGNLTSQYFANHYLSELDHLIKEQLQIKAYVRYMDDMVLWSDDKELLKKAYKSILLYVNETLHCELKPLLLNYTSAGMPFLGYLLFPYQVKLSSRSKKRFIQKMTALEKHYHSGEWSEAKCQRHALPLIAFTAKSDAKGFRIKVLHEMGKAL